MLYQRLLTEPQHLLTGGTGGVFNTMHVMTTYETSGKITINCVQCFNDQTALSNNQLKLYILPFTEKTQTILKIRGGFCRHLQQVIMVTFRHTTGEQWRDLAKSYIFLPTDSCLMFSKRFTDSVMLTTWGTAFCSSNLAYGIGTSTPVKRTTGASR